MSNEMKNTRKNPGAYVWYNGAIKRITNQKVDKEHVIVENRYEVKKAGLKLVKVGDIVEYDYYDMLPARCKEWGKMKITSFLDNDIVRTEVDTSGSHYSHFKLPANE
jgi:hypothetical protein